MADDLQKVGADVSTIQNQFRGNREFTQKSYFTHYLLTTVLMEGWVKRLSPQDTFGVSVLNSMAAKSNTIEAISDLSSEVKKNTTCLHTARVVSSKCPEAPTFIFDSKRGPTRP